MIRSIKGQFILSIFVAIGFVYSTFSNIGFTADEGVLSGRVLFFFIMILTVYNEGVLTEKYIQINMT